MSKLNGDIGQRKLINKLVPDSTVGELQGLLATGYDLNNDFFETDFLPTIFGLSAWDDRSWGSRIAMEKKLALTESVTVMTEASRYGGRPRSLRIELIPVKKAGGGVLHAKVILALYQNGVKLLVSSANLTDSGYRQNREVAALLSVSDKDPSAAPLLRQALLGMREVLAPWWTEGAERVASLATQKVEEYGKLSEDRHVSFVWTGKDIRLWEAFLSRWPHGEPVRRITVLSPFWSENPGNGFIDTFLHRLRERAGLPSDAELRLLAEAHLLDGNTYRPVLPPQYGAYDFSKLGVNASACAVDPTVVPEEVDYQGGFVGTRSLHAKVMLIEGPQTSLAWLGSANFTRHGWGFFGDPTLANIEAGLIIRRTDKDRRSLESLIPSTIGHAIPLTGGEGIKLAQPEQMQPERLWPVFIREIRLSPCTSDPTNLDLLVRLDPEKISGQWQVQLAEKDSSKHAQSLVSDDATLGDDDTHRAVLDRSQLNQILGDQEVLVTWWANPDGARYPINVELSARENLPLCSGDHRPREHHLIAYYQGRIAWEDLFPDPSEPAAIEELEYDAAIRSGVDTSGIQSYQIREFIEALPGIVEDLRQAGMSTASMRLALLGPVSPVSLARTVVESVRDGVRTPTAGAFQLVEILCCLGSTKDIELPERVRGEWHQLLAKASSEVEGLLARVREEHAKYFCKNRAFKLYEKAVRQALVQGGTEQ